MKNILFSLLILFSALTHSTAQKKPEHAKKFYVDPKTNKLYWPKEQGVYLFASDNPSGNNPVLLESKASKEYTNPMYLDTEGMNFIRSKWAVNPETKKAVYPQQEIKFEIYSDGLAPKTIPVLLGKNPLMKADKKFFSNEAIFTFESKDHVSGLDDIYFSLDSTDFYVYTNQIPVTSEGKHSISYYAVDNVGNTENIHTYYFTIDNSSPTTTLEVLNNPIQKNLISNRNKIKLSSEDEGSGVKTIYYSIDGTQKIYSRPINLSGISDGEHTLSYYSVDALGNKEASSDFLFTIDNTPPEVDIFVIGDQYQNRGRVFISSRTNIEIQAKDELSGLKEIIFSIDDGSESIYKEPFPLKKSAGEHIISYRAIDNVGNGKVGKISDRYAKRKGLDLDIIPPKISYSFDGDMIKKRDTIFVTSSTKIKLDAKDYNSGVNKIGYKLDGMAGTDYVSPFAVEGEKLHQLNFFASDLVNNRNTKDIAFYVDDQGPELSHMFSTKKIGAITLLERNLEVYSSNTKMFLTATDNQVDVKDIFYKINDSDFMPYTLPIELKIKGENNIIMKAIDELNNEAISNTLSIFIN